MCSDFMGRAVGWDLCCECIAFLQIADEHERLKDET